MGLNLGQSWAQDIRLLVALESKEKYKNFLQRRKNSAGIRFNSFLHKCCVNKSAGACAREAEQGLDLSRVVALPWNGWADIWMKLLKELAEELSVMSYAK